jgi:SWI/SNF-related matrix-associated actin-dependent regulator 1 of chromatin subfamily A
MKVVKTKYCYKIKPSFDGNRALQVQAVKELPERKYNASLECWEIPLKLQAEVTEIVKYFNAEYILDTRTNKNRHDITAPLPFLKEEPILATGAVRPYQNQGIARGLELKRFINGDEQGLGKTIQSIITLTEAERLGAITFPVLVICPSSTKINWQREWHKWTNKKAIVLRDRDSKNWHQLNAMGLADVIIVNYESLKKFFVTYYPPKSRLKNSLDIHLDPRADLFKSVTIDESHRCKGAKTQQTKIALRLAMGRDWRILLTGTSVVNSPLDLFAQIAIMGRLNQFGGVDGYKERYCQPDTPKEVLKELNWRLNKLCFFRREKKDVAKELPPKQRQTIICDISTREQYDNAQNDFERYLEKQGWDNDAILKKLSGEIMVKMQELKRISALGKINTVVDFANEVMAGGEKLILFCSLHAIVDALKSEFPKAVTVTGRDNDIQKQKNIDAFQQDPNVQLIICNIKAAGVGITLTASSRVGFVEYPWTYSDCVQCEDRAHRIGQENHVMCTYFLGQDTVDEHMYRLIQSKANVANTITGSTDVMKANFVDDIKGIFKRTLIKQ